LLFIFVQARVSALLQLRKERTCPKPQNLPDQFLQQMISSGIAARIRKAIRNITIHSVQIRKRSQKKNKKVTELGSNVCTDEPDGVSHA
jgi:hypothetical protein